MTRAGISLGRTISLPLWRSITDADLEAPSINLVEFDASTAWYEFGFTVLAQALQAGYPADIHIFQRPPTEAVDALRRYGLDVDALLRSDQLRVIDSYTVQTGAGTPGTAAGAAGFMTESVDLKIWGEAVARLLETEAPASERGRLHIDGNIAVLASYNSESDIVNFWRQRLLPLYRAREGVLITGAAHGFAADPFYRQMESLADTVIELGVVEGETGLDQRIRIRAARGRRIDTRWRPIHLTSTGEVAMGADVPVTGPAGATDIVSVLGRTGLESGLRDFLVEQSEVQLARFRVVGGYTRFEESTRNLLKDFRVRLRTAVERQPPKPENFLLWAPPGSGKTFFVHELADELQGTADLVELNLAAEDEPGFRGRLRSLEQAARSTLLFVDEVDSKPAEPWPYEALLPTLEPPAPRPVAVVGVLAGSSGGAIGGLKEAIRSRPKGSDLLSRVPPENELSVPALTREDRILVALTTLLAAAEREHRLVNEVEKLALFYIALSPKLSSPRPLREFVLRGLAQAPAGDDRLKFDHFFPAGDSESKEFWMGVRSAAPELVGSFLRVRA